jgi:hypothetical protein
MAFASSACVVGAGAGVGVGGHPKVQHHNLPNKPVLSLRAADILKGRDTHMLRRPRLVEPMLVSRKQVTCSLLDRPEITLDLYKSTTDGSEILLLQVLFPPFPHGSDDAWVVLWANGLIWNLNIVPLKAGVAPTRVAFMFGGLKTCTPMMGALEIPVEAPIATSMRMSMAHAADVFLLDIETESLADSAFYIPSSSPSSPHGGGTSLLRYQGMVHGSSSKLRWTRDKPSPQDAAVYVSRYVRKKMEEEYLNISNSKAYKCLLFGSGEETPDGQLVLVYLFNPLTPYDIAPSDKENMEARDIVLNEVLDATDKPVRMPAHAILAANICFILVARVKQYTSKGGRSCLKLVEGSEAHGIGSHPSTLLWMSINALPLGDDLMFIRTVLPLPLPPSATSAEKMSMDE